MKHRVAFEDEPLDLDLPQATLLRRTLEVRHCAQGRRQPWSSEERAAALGLAGNPSIPLSLRRRFAERLLDEQADDQEARQCMRDIAQAESAE